MSNTLRRKLARKVKAMESSGYYPTFKRSMNKR
jgi:hypothetical protein